MALNINGTTGISGVDGSASAPALQGTDSNTGINFASDTVNINTGGSTRVTVDSNGRLGIGVTSPVSPIHSHLSSSDANRIRVTNSTTGATASDGFIVGLTSAEEGIVWNYENSSMLFGTNNSERMRIDSSGNLLHGCTSATGGVSSGNFVVEYDGSTANAIKLRNTDTGSSTQNVIVFIRASSQVGSIVTNNSSTSYNTSSDYRLKENVTAISDGITRLKTLKPKRFNFIADAETTVDGFLAHEVTAVPEAITGTKDEVDSDNKPIYQGIDQSKLVPLLTAALQEAVAKIEVLETKVAALEAG